VNTFILGSAMEEKRKFERNKVNAKSEVHFDEGMTFSKSTDLSSGGLFISTPEPLSEGSEVSLSLQIPGEESVDIKGVVRWVRESSDDESKSGMGIEFVDVSESDLENIKKVVT
jgi:uncharacterized protein (TIGR02266 family)